MLFGVAVGFFGLPFSLAGIALTVGAAETEMGLPMILGIVFFLVGLGTTGLGVRRFQAGRRYGEVALELDDVPIPLGGELVGRVRMERGVTQGRVATLMLRHEAGRGGHHSAIEYRDYTQTIDARVEVDGAGAVVPVRLAVPRDWQETTAPDVYPHHWWSLDFALTPAGNEPNLAVTFPTLPVFQTPR